MKIRELRKLVKCENCKYSGRCYLTSYDGTGIFEAGVCKVNISRAKLVDLDALRICPVFTPKTDDKQPNSPF